MPNYERTLLSEELYNAVFFAHHYQGPKTIADVIIFAAPFNIGDLQLPLDIVDLCTLEEVKWSEGSSDGCSNILQNDLYGDTLGELPWGPALTFGSNP